MKLFKRGDDATASYYWRGMVNRKVYLWSTKTPDLSLAKKRAKAYRDAIVAEQFHLVDSMKTRSSTLTFGEVMQQYRDMPLGVSAVSRGKNIRGLVFVLEASGLGEGDRVDTLGRGLVTKFQTAGLAAKVMPTTLNSRLRGARSLFSARALMHYSPALPVAPVADFKVVPALPVAESLPQLPSDEAMAMAHKQLPANPEAYRAFLLAAYAGLRAGEVAAARWDWLDGDVLYVGGREYQAKSRKWRTVRIAPDAMALLVADKPVGATGPIVGATAGFLVTRILPSMLKALGFAGSSPIHSCRRWYGSHVATASGIYAAQTALGHSTPAVTAKAYARLLNIPAGVAVNPASS